MTDGSGDEQLGFTQNGGVSKCLEKRYGLKGRMHEFMTANARCYIPIVSDLKISGLVHCIESLRLSLSTNENTL